MHDDYYVILIFPFGKQDTNYAVVFFLTTTTGKTTWQFSKVKFCDFEEYFIWKNILGDPFSR